MLGRRDLLVVTGLARARRLQNVVAPHKRTAEFSSTVGRQKCPSRAHFQVDNPIKLLYNNYIINFKALKNI